MKVDLYCLFNEPCPRLGTMPRPRGGDWLEDEIRSLRDQEVDVLVSLLTPDEVEVLDLAGEEAACWTSGIQFLSFPIPDRSVPGSKSAALEFVRALNHMRLDGKNVVIHCRVGIGRASLMTAALLTLQGSTPTEAFGKIAAARGCPVPDAAEQFVWVEELFGFNTR
jgi:protein-tyrosine phosphatase